MVILSQPQCASKRGPRKWWEIPWINKQLARMMQVWIDYIISLPLIADGIVSAAIKLGLWPYWTPVSGTHWSSMRLNMVSWNLVNIGSGNGMSPVWHQALAWSNVELSSITPLCKKVKFESKYNHFLARNCIWKCCLQNIHLPFHSSLYVLTHCGLVTPHGVADHSQH